MKHAMQFVEEQGGQFALHRCFRGKAWKLEKLKPFSMHIHRYSHFLRFVVAGTECNVG
jgi:hypothetical protein